MKTQKKYDYMRLQHRKQKIRMILILAVILVLGLIDAMKSAEAASGQGEVKPVTQITVAAFDVDMLNVDDDAEVLLVVQSNGEEINATGELFAFTRTKDRKGNWTNWEEQLIGIPAKMGRKGMGKTREGDQKTPVGMFQMNTPFGICAKKEGFPESYIQVTDSMYWNGDASSETYNLLVDRNKTTDFNPADSEHLKSLEPYYNYALNIGYNADCVKGAGSALFLHCLGKNSENTGGCIAVSEENMIRILRLYKEKKTMILIANKGGFNQYFKEWANENGVISDN